MALKARRTPGCQFRVNVAEVQRLAAEMDSKGPAGGAERLEDMASFGHRKRERRNGTHEDASSSVW
jgi:hypothetical protein